MMDFFIKGWVGGAVVAAAGLAVMTAWNPFFPDIPWLAAGMLAAAAAAGRRFGWRSGPVAAGAAAAAVWAGCSLVTPQGAAPVRTLIYGVDGGTFAVIDAMGEELPAFMALRREGSRAQLTSMEPMFSPVLWTTIASGRMPDDHGIRGFFVHADDCRVARFWDVAEQAGQRVGLYKWLVDYPPRQIAGFWVPSWLAPAAETWPPELGVVKELELSRRLRRKQVTPGRSALAAAPDLIRAGLRLSTAVRAAWWLLREKVQRPDPVTANVEQQLLRGWIDRDVFVRQLYKESPEIASFTYYATDGLAHLYWDRYEKGGDELRAAYRQADAILAEFRARLSPDARLLIFSDHGFKAMDAGGQAGQFAPATARLKARMSAAVGPVDVSRVGAKLSVGLQSEAQRAQALLWLAQLTDSTGQPFFLTADTPDSRLSLALTLRDEHITPARMQTDTVGGEAVTDYVTLTDSYTGTHRADGIFYAWGRGVGAGVELPEMRLIDAAPTIFAAAGLAASVEMPGHAVIFEEKARVQELDGLIEGLPWLTGAEGVEEERLRQLGYVDGK